MATSLWSLVDQDASKDALSEGNCLYFGPWFAEDEVPKFEQHLNSAIDAFAPARRLLRRIAWTLCTGDIQQSGAEKRRNVSAVPSAWRPPANSFSLTSDREATSCTSEFPKGGNQSLQTLPH
jgi:hypothetical protein